MGNSYQTASGRTGRASCRPQESSARMTCARKSIWTAAIGVQICCLRPILEANPAPGVGAKDSNLLHGGEIMLVLARRLGETIIIGGDIRITVVETNGGCIRLRVAKEPHQHRRRYNCGRVLPSQGSGQGANRPSDASTRLDLVHHCSLGAFFE